jgi:thiol-disulfide isomerase/thioredoxin
MALALLAGCAGTGWPLSAARARSPGGGVAPRAPSASPARAAPSTPSPAAPAAPAGRPPSDQLAELGYGGDPGSSHGKCPGAADGRELVGAQLPGWQLTDWANTAGRALDLASLRGRVVVVRFWTSGCQYCEKTLPALQKLSQELRGQPVTFVGAFHAKPVTSEQDLRRPLRVARAWGVTFPIAFDRDWRTLRAWWLDGFHRHATSVTFVIGKDGRVVHVHPGPVFYPTDDPDQAEINRDYQALRRAVIAAAAAR